MIVKDESKVILRCLKSVIPLIDYWIIVDTGSTDGTQKIITEFMKSKSISGELHERSWINFAHNRNEALALAKGKGDYLFFIDADDYLVFDDDFKLFIPPQQDSYLIISDKNGVIHSRTQLVNNALDWQWIGDVHEYITSLAAKTSAVLEKITTVYTMEGSRIATKQKFKSDIEILEESLKKNPENPRNTFYLAQSYRDFGDLPKALEYYQKVIVIGVSEQEIFWSMLQVAHLQRALDKSLETFIASYYEAYYYRPTRIEPIYYLASYYRLQNNYELAYKHASIGKTIIFPSDTLFVEKWIYDFGMWYELLVSAYYLKKYEECDKLCRILLNNLKLPDNYRKNIEMYQSLAKLQLQK